MDKQPLVSQCRSGCQKNLPSSYSQQMLLRQGPWLPNSNYVTSPMREKGPSQPPATSLSARVRGVLPQDAAAREAAARAPDRPDLVPGGWPGSRVPAPWPVCHSTGRWGCRARCPSLHSAACRSPQGREKTGCPPRGASVGTPPRLEELRREEEITKSFENRGRGEAASPTLWHEAQSTKRHSLSHHHLLL